MSQDRQWIIDLLRRLGYTTAAEEAARDRHGISRDEIMSQMGGSP
jgi:hypothetical protein